MNPDEIGKICIFNSILGFIGVILIIYLQSSGKYYNHIVDIILVIALTLNFCLSLWNFKRSLNK